MFVYEFGWWFGAVWNVVFGVVGFGFVRVVGVGCALICFVVIV